MVKRRGAWAGAMLSVCVTASAVGAPLPRPIIYVPFDGQVDVAYVGPSRCVRFRVDGRHVRAGVRGHGLFFHPESCNYLPAQVANPQPRCLAEIQCHGAKVSLSATERVRPEHALCVEPQVPDARVDLPPVELVRKPGPMEKTRSYVFSFYAKTTRDAQALDVRLQGVTRSDKGEHTGEAKRTVRVGARWTRHAVLLDLPTGGSRDRVQITLAVPGPGQAGPLWLDCLQLEPAKSYPQFQHCPTQWMPGGSRRRNRFPSFPIGHLPFPDTKGALCLWTRLDNDTPDLDPGELTWLLVGAFWRRGWEFSSSEVGVFRKRIRARKIKATLADGRFHHVALAWDEKGARLFLDGNKIGATTFGKPVALTAEHRDTYRVYMGRHNPRRRTPHGVLDEIAVFDVALDADQIGQIVRRQTALVPDAGLRVFYPRRWAFLRSEDTANLDLEILCPATVEASAVRAAVRGIPQATCAVVRTGKRTVLRIALKPWLMSPGVRTCEIELVCGPERVTVKQPIHIHPGRARDRYPVAVWGAGRPTSAHLAWLRSLGVRAVDSGANDPVYLNRLPADRMDGIFHFNNYAYAPHPLTTRNMQQYRDAATDAAQAIRPFPWVDYCLLNSEVSGRDQVDESDVLRAELKSVFGLDKSPLTTGTGWKDLAVRPRVDLRSFASTGIVPTDHVPYRYLRWLIQRGCGMPLVCKLSADVLHEHCPHVKVLSEPAAKMPFVHGWHVGRDLVGEWHYPLQVSRLLARWDWGLAEARHDRLGFYPIIGYIYAAPYITVNTGGKPLTCSLSPDVAAAQLWLALAQPSRLIVIWHFDTRLPHRKCTPQPGLYERTKRVLTGGINRLGAVLGRVPKRRPALAVLHSFSTAVGLGAERWWHWYPQVLHTFSAALHDANIPFDVLYEQDVREGALAGYTRLWIPAVKYLSADVYASVRGWSAKGGRVYLDNLANPALQFDKTTRVNALQEKRPYLRPEPFQQWAEAYRRATPIYALPTAGRVFTIVKQQAGAKYVFVVNNRWTEGWAAEHGGKVADRGVAQDVTVALREPGPVVVYDLLESRRVDVKPSGPHRGFSLHLGPGAGRVYAVLPRALTRLACGVPATVSPGAVHTVTFTLTDARGPAPGVQGIALDVIDPQGRVHDASGVYRLTNGRTTVPLRLALDAPRGRWRIRARELCSGRGVAKSLRVD